MIQLQEHEQFVLNGTPVERDEKYNNLNLIQWCKPMDNSPLGYYASFKIGAEWIDERETLVVTAKRGMQNIDFLRMFMVCFSSDLAIDSFSKIYSIDVDKPAIVAPALTSVVSPLIVFHFLSVVSKIKTLKKDYVHIQGNLKKVKGHIKLLKNERTNIATKRYDRIFCEYDEYSVDTPENRLLKKAILFSLALINRMNRTDETYSRIKQVAMKVLSRFENVSDEVNLKSIGQLRAHKLFAEYAEAVRLAKLILKHFDYNISNVGANENKVTPFVLDMSLLYEHYVYGLLYEAYHEKISYQFAGETGFPDFLYKSRDFKAILDTKYIPKYENASLDTNVVRQLSGYSRDLPILRKLGYADISEDSPIPSVPCVIIYPTEGNEACNPFKGNKLSELCTKHVKNLFRFYKICIPVPTIVR
jgi:5-methylcytosine-specific restriction enzyme subunit McrC